MIKFGKVIIRPIEREELGLIQKWYNDDEVMYWGSGCKPDMMVSLDYLEQVWFDEAYADTNIRMMIQTDEGEPIGIIGYRNMNIQERRCKIIIFIGEKKYWGSGYGTDAMKAFLRFLFNRWNMHRVEIDTWDGNERAIKSYKKCGFIEEGRLREARFVDGQYRDEILMGLLRKEFNQ